MIARFSCTNLSVNFSRHSPVVIVIFHYLELYTALIDHHSVDHFEEKPCRNTSWHDNNGHVDAQKRG